MKVGELAKELAAGKFRAVYLLAGAEALLRDEALALLRGAVLEGTADDFNHQRLEAARTPLSSLREALEALPIMAQRCLVELRMAPGKKIASKEFLEVLAEELPPHQQQGASVLVISVTSVDKRQRWFKALGKATAAVVVCDSPGAAGAVSFVRDEADRQGVALERGAAERLVELAGPRLLLLRQEIAKAALLAGVDEKVTAEHVEAATTQSADQPVWDLTDAVGAGQTAEALELLARLREESVPPVLLGVLASHFRRLSRVRDGGKVGGPPFVLKNLERQARRYSPARLRSSMQAIHETDVAIKGGSVLADDLAIERLVLALSS